MAIILTTEEVANLNETLDFVNSKVENIYKEQTTLFVEIWKNKLENKINEEERKKELNRLLKG